MTRRCGHCTAPPGYRPTHTGCPREWVETGTGVTRRCDCDDKSHQEDA